MAINDNGTRDQYVATASQTIFPYTFEIFDQADVAVEQNGTLLSIGTHYTVSGVNVDSGGNITLVTGATAGDVLTIYRDMALSRVTDYQNNGAFLADDIDSDFDRLWAALQQNKGSFDLGLRANINDAILNSTNTILAATSVRANKALAFTSTGELDYIAGTMPVGTLRNYTTLTAMVSDVANISIGDISLLDERTTGNGGGAKWKAIDATTSPGNAPNGFDIVAGNAAVSLQLIVGPIAYASQFGIVGDIVTDNQAAMVYLHSNYLRVHYEAGDYKYTVSPVLRRSAHVTGDNAALTYMSGYGVDGFTANGADADWITVEDMTFLSYSGVGAADPRTASGINLIGTAANHVNHFAINRCSFQGWDSCINGQYLWSSTLNNVQTVNSNTALRLFGQSVNNTIDNSKLGANGSAKAVIDIVADGAVIGEGLMVSNSLIAEGAFAFRTNNGFLSLSISACTIDLITDIAFKMVDTRTLSVGDCWIYAVNKCFEFADLGSLIEVKASFSGCHMATTSATGIVGTWGTNNKGLTINGGSMTCSTSGRLLSSNGESVSVNTVHGINASSNAAYLSINSTSTFKIGKECTGSFGVEFTGGLPSQGVYPIASLGITGATGAKISGFGATPSRISIGLYRITYDQALSSALVTPQISIRRTGQNAVTWEINNLTTTYYEIVTRDAAGALFDPTDIYITIYN